MKERLPTVHYLSLRSIPAFEKEKRRNPPSGQKQDYIIDTLASLGYHVNYVSFSESAHNKFYRAKKKRLSDHVTFFLTPNVPGKFRESFAFRWFCHLYAPCHIKPGDILLVYHIHTNGMRNDLLRALADKRHLTFVYEVEELFEYAHETVSQKLVEEEIAFLQCPDKYLFCTETLASTVNKRNLPYAICEGYYKYVRADLPKWNDGKIHCVYGGIIDTVKGGAIRAVRAAEFLPENYVVHILGFGDVGALKKEIEQISPKTACEIRFEGLKKGQDYIDFISRCDIGLCLQTMDQNLTATSFPSKLVLYLSCGLYPVALGIEQLKTSRLSENITFYSEDTPKSIADAILQVTPKEESVIRNMMDRADKTFTADLKSLLS